MPYTPPSQQSPASSKNSSPYSSRSPSISEDGTRSPVTGRTQPPRSNSASYTHKQRRSPSVQRTDSANTSAPTETLENNVKATDFAHLESVRQSPPPVNNLVIPTGMVLSPPESPENSDGDGEQERGRQVDWDQLKQAVRAIDMKREGSPDKVGVHLKPTDNASEPVSQITSPTALSAEARKISHSRSNTEGANITIPRSASFDSPLQISDSDDDEGPFSKPHLVRKKSGELVKPALRPSSRRRYSSMPGTPTYSKSVHFKDSDNQTRHFLQVDKPMAVSAGSSPVETYDNEAEFPFNGETVEREICLANFPEDSFERQTQPVRLEKMHLSSDKQTLIGTCAVQNIAFHKAVAARFTLDHWMTTSEVTGEYQHDPRSSTDGCDRFSFQIKLSDQANIDDKTLLICVRYTVNGQEYWDNNRGMNYQVEFIKAVRKTKPSVVVTGLGARPHTSLPRSRHSPPSSSRGQKPSLDDDFTRLDSSASYSFGSNDTLLDESGGTIKLKPRNKRGSAFPSNNAGQHPANGLGGRYDFGASLSAALSSAQDKLGRESGLMNPAQKQSGGSYFGPLDRKEGPTKADERPDALTTDRPAMGSDQYRDLVQKFCYFTPGSGKGPRSPQPVDTQESAAAPIKTDGTLESASTSRSSTNSSSPQLDGNNERAVPAFSPFVSRSGSPAPVTGGGLGARSTTPISFGYPYHSSGRDGYLSDSSTPTAIRG
ncbi:hypothetical protein D0865_09679 [Hortaea werneckii]|uniref:CBM21 domain-containing protein n=1 Tax=Hortaea werneckii TaxID=91943 RepID=A0A3M7C113_HORWE|nr:hypothetical protein D0865_09679 [Hortaea werneckii]